ncbi:MAG TPA: hypothetical protein DGD08_04080 [Gemmatimonas aurantiaca]|uniref:Antitoxin n=1 Tax=Gemmatimonas aurantiaca TaxID=173480 RepID=A0A3D4V5G5_9BACT|nr:hypothetical protein [Gemmatimonas aurantiaca]
MHLMRTTLDIDEDVLEAAKERARRESKTAGQVVSELLRGARCRRPRSARNAEPEAERVDRFSKRRHGLAQRRPHGWCDGQTITHTDTHPGTKLAQHAAVGAIQRGVGVHVQQRRLRKRHQREIAAHRKVPSDREPRRRPERAVAIHQALLAHLRIGAPLHLSRSRSRWRHRDRTVEDTRPALSKRIARVADLGAEHEVIGEQVIAARHDTSVTGAGGRGSNGMHGAHTGQPAEAGLCAERTRGHGDRTGQQRQHWN